MDISKLQFGQLSAKLNISQKFENLDVNGDNKINAQDLLSTSNSEILNALNSVLNDTDTDTEAELAEDASFDFSEIDNALKSDASSASAQTAAPDVEQTITPQTPQNNDKPTLEKGKYMLNGKPYTGLIGGIYYEKGKKAKGTKLFDNVLYVKGEKAKGEVLFKKMLYINGEKAQGSQIYKKILYVNGEKSKDTTVFNNVLFIKGKQASGTKLHDNVLYEKGVKSTKTTLYKNKLFVNGELSTGEVNFKNKMYKDGDLLDGASLLDGKYYKKGKLFTGNTEGLYYKKGIAYADKKSKTALSGVAQNGLAYTNGQLANDTIDGQEYLDGEPVYASSEINGTNVSISKSRLLSYLSIRTQECLNARETNEVTERLKQDVLMVKYAEKQAELAGEKGTDEYNSTYNQVIKSLMIKTPENMENKAGEVVEKADGLYVNNGSELVKMDISSDIYLKLFPPIKRYDINQGNIGDCYFISGCLIDMMKNPKAFAQILQMFSENENGDINITFQGSLKNYSPVKFPNGELYAYDKFIDGEYIDLYSQGGWFFQSDVQSVDGAKGIVMLEQAYSISKFASDANRDTDTVDIDETIASITGGWMNDVYKEVLGLENTFTKYRSEISNIRFKISEELFDKIADDISNNKKLIGISIDMYTRNKPRGIVANHAYSIEKIDKENKLVYITNPWFGGGSMTIPYSELLKCEEIRIATGIIDK